MTDRSPSRVTTVGLLRRRAAVHRRLLASAGFAVAVAVATVLCVRGLLVRAVTDAASATLPGIDPDEVAARVADGRAALDAASPALAILVLVVAAIAVSQLAALTQVAREQETAALRARGLSLAQMRSMHAVEGGLIALAGGVVGMVGGGVALILSGLSPSEAGAQWPWGVGAVVALGVASAVSAQRGSRRLPAPRARLAVVGVLLAMLLAATAFVVWQLPQARPGRIDPVVAVAPAVVLAAAAVTALGVFGVAARSMDRFPAVRSVARRLPVFAVAVLLVSLAAAQVVFASAYGATWTAMTAASSAVRAGADLRVDLAPQTASPATIATAAAVEGVSDARPALVGEIEIGSTDVALVGAPTTDVPGVEVDADATGIRIETALTATGPIPNVALSVILLDGTGAAATVTLDGRPGPGPDGAPILVGEAPLPTGTAPWRLLGIVATMPVSWVYSELIVTVTGATAVGGGALDIAGEAPLSSGEPEASLWAASSDDDALPVAVTADLAERLGVGIGEGFEFRYAGTGRRATVEIVEIVGAVRGATGTAVSAPLGSLYLSQLQNGDSVVAANSVWAEGSPDAASALSAALGDRPVLTSEPGLSEGVVGALVPAWWAAAGGSAVLALIGALAIVQTMARGRRRELGILRALGIPPAQQGRRRAGETVAALLSALLLGGAVGVIAAHLSVVALVRASTPGILRLDAGTSFATLPLLLLLGVLAVGCGVIAVASGIGVAVAARTAVVGEESR